MHHNHSPGRINEEKTPEQCYHKELIRVSDGAGAQVGVWMTNKCKAQMIGDDLYNM